MIDCDLSQNETQIVLAAHECPSVPGEASVELWAYYDKADKPPDDWFTSWEFSLVDGGKIPIAFCPYCGVKLIPENE